jgi:putative ATPase
LGEGNFIEQEYLPEKIKGTKFYDPGRNAREEELRRFLKERWKEKYGYLVDWFDWLFGWLGFC